MKHSKFGERDNSIGLLFWQVSTRWQREIKKGLRKFDLTHTQYVILAVIEELNETEKSVTQRKVSDLSTVDTMTVSSTLRLLSKKGLVMITESKADTRANSIEITQQGRNLLMQAIEVVENTDQQFFFQNEQKLAQFKKMLMDLNSD